MEQNEIHLLQKIVDNAENAMNDIKSFLNIADKVRSFVVPQNSYPGIIEICSPELVSRIIHILDKFSSFILKNFKSLDEHRQSRGVDAFLLTQLFKIVKYCSNTDTISHSEIKENIYNGLKYSESISEKRKNITESEIFNICAYLFKKKKYDFVYYLVDIFPINERNYKLPLYQKVISLEINAMIGLGKTEESKIYELLNFLIKPDKCLLTLIGNYPPQRPELLKNICLKCSQIEYFLPYFALNGCFDIISKSKTYEHFFPDLDMPPNIICAEHEEIYQEYCKCYQYFEKRMFYEVALMAVEILKKIPRKKITPLTLLLIFILHYWITYSFDACGLCNRALFYVKQMERIFEKYPFALQIISAFSLKIHINLNDIKNFTPISVDKNYDINWNSTFDLYKALYCSSEDNPNSLHFFERVFNSNNDIVKSIGFHYYITELRVLGIHPDLEEFSDFCLKYRDTTALYYYHKAIEMIQYENIKDVWNLTKLPEPDIEIIDILTKAESKAHGYAIILRKIKQLKALIIGRTNPTETAMLITTSLSTTFDNFLRTQKQTQCKLEFPILSIAYLNIVSLEPCLLMALYHPNSKPFVIRILVGSNVEKILEKIEKAELNLNISENMDSKVWWEKQKLNESYFAKQLQEFQDNVLGVWSGLLTPCEYSQKLHLIQSILISYIHTLPSKKQIEAKTKLEQLIQMQLPLNVKCVRKLPLALILGKHIHQIPWESLPCTRANESPIARIPSLRILCLGKHIPALMNTKSGYYVIDPCKDTNYKEDTLELFRKSSWEGIVRDIPAASFLIQQFQHKDIYTYCGHGSGAQFCNYEKFTEENCPIRVSMFLMGCRSNKLEDNGECEPCGTPYYCIAAGSNSVVGNLWNVFNLDIDRVLIGTFRQFFENKCNDLDSALIKGKNSCILKIMTGGATVRYGIPISWRYRP